MNRRARGSRAASGAGQQPAAPAAAGTGDGPVPPAWGWREPMGGRAPYVDPGAEYQATTFQLCGLWPFTDGGGAPVAGTPVGRHQLSGEVVCLDPLEWTREGLVTNPGMFLLGEPGTGKSALVKRLVTGCVARGGRVMIMGDPRPDYTALAEHLGGQVIKAGRGAGRLNPLDPGPLGQALARLGPAEAAAVRAESRARRLSLLMALCALTRGVPVGNDEEVLLGRALDLLDDRGGLPPDIPAVLAVIEEGPEAMRTAARADDTAAYRARTAPLAFTLAAMLNGVLAGAFDGQSTVKADLDAPVVSVDISRAGGAGDKLLTAAMLCTWAAGTAIADGAALLADAGLAVPRPGMAVLDELWRALRGAPGLVEHADSLTRLNRARGMASVMITHSLADLDALPSEEDRAKARGFMERSSITVMSALPPRELDKVSEVTPLTGPERDLVAAWSAPDSWRPGSRHPGRGKYLIKAGGRLGIPVDLALEGAEWSLYDTDQAIRAAGPGLPGYRERKAS